MYCTRCHAQVNPTARISGGIIRVDYGHEGWDGYHVPTSEWAEYALDGTLLRTGQDDFTRPTEPEAMAAAAAEYASRLRQAKTDYPWLGRLPAHPLYVRFGQPPKSGRSKNYVTGRYEAGVSAYRAEIDRADAVIRFAPDAVLPGTLIGYAGRKPAYLLIGEEVGRGSDGEPLLRRVRVVASLKYRPDADGFRPLNGRLRP